MKRVSAMAAIVIVSSGLGASTHEDAASARGPASPLPVAANQQDADSVKWTAHCDLDDGRRLITDGSLIVEARYLPNVAVPEKSVPPQAAQRLMRSDTDREFGPDELERKGAAGGHYLAPGGIQLNRKYVELLRGSGLKGTLRFRGKGPSDPVLILDGKKVVGVVMPMKKV